MFGARRPPLRVVVEVEPTFSPSQFGGTSISNNVAFESDSTPGFVRIDVMDATDFSAAGWTYTGTAIFTGRFYGTT